MPSLSPTASAHAAAVRQRCAGKTLDLPLLPEVAHKVRSATRNPEGDALTLANVIRRDAAFAGYLLRVANSPAYAARAPSTSLQQAVSRLGLRTIGEIAIVIACSTRAFAVKGHEGTVRALFRHALATALYAREIARLRRLNVEDAFLAGLLHDVGRPTVIQALVDQQTVTSLPLLSPVEFDLVVSDLHEEVGAEIILAWTLPMRLAESIRHHHDPERASGDCRPMAALLALADDLSHFAVPLRRVTEEGLHAHPAAGLLNLYPEEIVALVARASQIVSQVDGLS